MNEWDLILLRKGVHADLPATPVPQLYELLSAWPRPGRSELLQRVGESVRGDGAASDEALRVSLARVLVALLPDSFDMISDLLEWRAGARAYEVHFSLFCFLDDPPATADRQLRDRVATLVEDYLRTVRASTARAAWMAGDLLGDHWVTEEAVPRLIRLATDARFVAGRHGAVHGLAHALPRSSKPTQLEIVATIRAVAERDRSARIRRQANYLLSGKWR